MVGDGPGARGHVGIGFLVAWRIGPLGLEGALQTVWSRRTAEVPPLRLNHLTLRALTTLRRWGDESINHSLGLLVAGGGALSVNDRVPSAPVVGAGFWYLLGEEAHGRLEIRIGLEHLRGVGAAKATHTTLLMLGAGIGGEGG